MNREKSAGDYPAGTDFVRKNSLILVFGILFILYLSPLGLSYSAVGVLVILLPGAMGIMLAHIPHLRKWGLPCIVLSLGLLWGYSFLYRLELDQNNFYPAYKDVDRFQGVVLNESLSTSEGGFVHTLALRRVWSDKKSYSTNASGRVRILSRKGEKLYTGEKVMIRSTLTRVETEPEFHFISYAGGPEAILREGFYSWLPGYRYLMLSALESGIRKMGPRAGPLFKALFLGAKEDLSPEIRDSFERTGTLHLLALSGLHVGIVYLLITLLLLPLPGQGMKWIAGALAILFYLILVGPRPSLLRASLMVILFGLTKILGREGEPLNILSLSAFLILFFDPVAAFSLSFQLSFLALVGIILAGKWILPPLSARIPRPLAAVFSSSIGAQGATTPLMLKTFGAFYPSGIIVTLLLIPLVTVFVWLGIVVMVLNLFDFSPVVMSGSFLLEQLYSAIYTVASLFKQIPGIRI